MHQRALHIANTCIQHKQIHVYTLQYCNFTFVSMYTSDHKRALFHSNLQHIHSLNSLHAQMIGKLLRIEMYAIYSYRTGH